MSSVAVLSDQRQRPLGVLRFSLTARCNLACPYCCPDPQDPPGLLSLDQQLRLIRVAVRLGVKTLRLTGGEPLLSDRLLPLLEAVALGRATPGDPLQDLRQVALTSNGQLLNLERAAALRAAGLDRITLSLDAVDAAQAARMAGLQGGAASGHRLVQKVLAALEAARRHGFDPSLGAVKLNAVIKRGCNDDQLIPLAGLARREGVELRLIEYMDVGNRNGWKLDHVLTAAEMVNRIHRHWPLQPEGRTAGGTANRWRYADGRGSIGVVASISAPFCGDCNRLRITADGKAYTCLFASQGTDLTPALHSEAALAQMIGDLWVGRNDRYSEDRQRSVQATTHAEMAYLGG